MGGGLTQRDLVIMWVCGAVVMLMMLSAVAFIALHQH